MPSHRRDRAAGTLRREISWIVARELRDPAAAAFRVSEVVLSPDKRSARVRLAPWDPDTSADFDEESLRAFERASGFIRKGLAQRLRMRQVPELYFEYDRGEQHVRRIETLLDRIRKRSQTGLGALLALMTLPSVDVLAAPPLERLEFSAAIMGSEFRIACYAPNRKLAAGAVTAAFDEVRRVDALLSHYKPESELSRINRNAARGPVRVSREMADLLATCLRYSSATEGAFDITVGALVKAWGFYQGRGSLPGLWTLWRARWNTGFQHVQVDQTGRTVRFLRSGLSLDPGGIGKGYAVDRAVEVLRGYGIERALVSSGTSSIYAMGAPPGKAAGWRVTVRGPASPDSKTATVSLRDKALSTSGTYEKFFEANGRRYGHILDPRTGRPAAGPSAVSVIGPLTTDTEVWATALIVNGEEWARTHPVPKSRIFLCPENGPCGWLTNQ